MNKSKMKYFNEKGFTLVEVLIAVTILTIGILGIAGLSGRAALMHGSSRMTSLGVNIAQDRMESIFKIPFNDLTQDENADGAKDLYRTCDNTILTVGVEFVTKCTPLDDADATRSIISVKDTSGAANVNTGLILNFVWEYYVVTVDVNGDGSITSEDKVKKVDVVVNWFDPMSRDRKYFVLSSYRSK